jgi:hypothetical protein
MAYREEVDALRARIEQLEGENRELQWELTKARAKTHISSRPPRQDNARVQELETQNQTLHWDLAAMKVKARVGSFSPNQSPETSFFGVPKSIQEDREIDVELSPAGHDALWRALRDHFGKEGTAESSPTSFAWQLDTRGEALLIVQDGRTRVRVADKLANMLHPSWTVMIGTIPLMPLLFQPGSFGIAGILLFMLAQTNLFLFARILHARMFVSQRRQKLAQLANELEPIIRLHAKSEAKTPLQVRLSNEDSEDDELEDQTMTRRSRQTA